MSKPPPHIDARVIEWLEEVFPDQLPRNEVTPYHLGSRVGEQRVIDKLRAQYRIQTENIDTVIPG